MKRTITIIVIVVIVGLIAFQLASNKKKIDAQKTAKIDTTEVRVAVNTQLVKEGISSKKFTLLGTVAADQVVDLKAQTSGRITNMYVDLGDKVKKGALIAKIDNQLLEIGVSNAQQKLADAKQNNERYTKLYQGGAATKAQFEQYKLTYENAQNQLSQAQKQLADANITAPFSGTISARDQKEGAYVNVGTPIATIIDVHNLKVELNVSEKDAYTLNEGDAVEITSGVYPGVTYTGKITFISPQGNEAHNYPVEVAFENHPDNPLKAGTYVNVHFTRKSASKVLQIPRAALVGSIQDARVYVVNDNGMAYLRDITIGADNGDYLEVIKGLKPGERIVTTGQINLADSTEVQVIQ